MVCCDRFCACNALSVVFFLHVSFGYIDVRGGLLRSFLSDDMVCALKHTGLFDREVLDPPLEEKLNRI